MLYRKELLEKPIIFVGPGRSGSTIISEFIMEHEQLAWPSNYLELFPGISMSNYVRRLFDNRFWRMTGEKAQKINRTRRLNEAIPRPAEAYPFWQKITRKDIDFSRGFLLGEVASDEERDSIRSTFAGLVAAQARQRLIIKITGPGRIAYLQSIFPDAIFINVLRDRSATIRSLLNVPFWKDLGMYKLWWTGAYSEDELQHYKTICHDPAASTGFQLDKIIETTQQEAQLCGANMNTVLFEGFISNPETVINQILKITDLPESKWITRKLQKTSIRQDSNIAPEKTCTP
jgi:hypothetical protein